MFSTSQARQAFKTYPLGESPVMFQRWENLLFLHWKISPKWLQTTLPTGLFVDQFAGNAYIGIVPFFMQAVRPAYLPSLPHLSYFQEVNVRTYVIDQNGIPGVWFYSLDANRRIAVLIAQKIFALSYYLAKMSASYQDSGIQYSALRVGSQETAEYEYFPGEILDPPNPETLESFLLDRYLLYSYNKHKSQLYSGRVWHLPYRLRQVRLASFSDAPMKWNGFDSLENNPDHVCMSANVDVQIFKLKKLIIKQKLVT